MAKLNSATALPLLLVLLLCAFSSHALADLSAQAPVMAPTLGMVSPAANGPGSGALGGLAECFQPCPTVATSQCDFVFDGLHTQIPTVNLTDLLPLVGQLVDQLAMAQLVLQSLPGTLKIKRHWDTSLGRLSVFVDANYVGVQQLAGCLGQELQGLLLPTPPTGPPSNSTNPPSYPGLWTFPPPSPSTNSTYPVPLASPPEFPSTNSTSPSSSPESYLLPPTSNSTSPPSSPESYPLPPTSNSTSPSSSPESYPLPSTNPSSSPESYPPLPATNSTNSTNFTTSSGPSSLKLASVWLHDLLRLRGHAHHSLTAKAQESDAIFELPPVAAPSTPESFPTLAPAPATTPTTPGTLGGGFPKCLKLPLLSFNFVVQLGVPGSVVRFRVASKDVTKLPFLSGLQGGSIRQCAVLRITR